MNNRPPKCHQILEIYSVLIQYFHCILNWCRINQLRCFNWKCIASNLIIFSEVSDRRMPRKITIIKSCGFSNIDSNCNVAILKSNYELALHSKLSMPLLSSILKQTITQKQYFLSLRLRLLKRNNHYHFLHLLTNFEAFCISKLREFAKSFSLMILKKNCANIKFYTEN